VGSIIFILFDYMSDNKKWRICLINNTIYDKMQSRESFTKDGMPKTPFPMGWKGENGLYTVGFTRRGLLGSASDAVKIAEDIADQWMSVKDKSYRNSHMILLKST